MENAVENRATSEHIDNGGAMVFDDPISAAIWLEVQNSTA